jgi:hypothetical protein
MKRDSGLEMNHGCWAWKENDEPPSLSKVDERSVVIVDP